MAKAGVVYAGGDDGVVTWSDPASIGRWRRIGQELAGQQVRTIVAHSALTLDVLLGSGEVAHSDDGAQSWRHSGTAAVALAGHAIAPTTLFLATASGEIQRSNDAGATWQPCPQGERMGGTVVALLVDPHSAQRLLVALQTGTVWVSDDGGQRWDGLGTGLPGALEALVASPTRPHVLFAAAGGRLWRVGESGLWAQAAGSLVLAPGAPLAVLPGAAEVLLAASVGPEGVPGLARSDDDGDSWQAAATDAPLAGAVSVIAAATYHPDTAWAGTAGGQLLLTSDRGRSWRVIATGLAPLRALAAVRLA